MKCKLTNKEIRELNNIYVYLSQKELECFVPVAMNVVTLEPKAKPITDFVEKIIKKIGKPVEGEADKITFDTKEFDELTKAFMSKTQEVELEKIKRSSLEVPEIKMAGGIITLLFRLKLIE